MLWSRREQVIKIDDGVLVRSVWARISTRRCLAWTVVLLVHAIAWLVLTIPPAPIESDATVHRDMASDVVPVRWIRSMPVVTTPSPPVAGASAQMHVSMPRRQHVKRHDAVPARVVPRPKPSGQTKLSLGLPSTGAAGKHWSIGRNLHSRKRKPPRIPGQGRVYGAPVFAMADPRFQGIAGLARVAQGLLGAVNPHCVDVDVWRGMSSKDLHQHHLTRFMVQHTAHEYRCGPPRTGVHQPDGTPVY